MVSSCGVLVNLFRGNFRWSVLYGQPTLSQQHPRRKKCVDWEFIALLQMVLNNLLNHVREKGVDSSVAGEVVLWTCRCQEDATWNNGLLPEFKMLKEISNRISSYA